MKKILVIEDEENLRRAIKSKLEDDGYKVFLSNTVDSAIKYVKKENIDLVWLDHYLSGEKDGLDFLREIKEIKEKAKTPVILVTNTCSADKYNVYLKLGVARYFVKADNSLASIAVEIKDLI